LTDINNERYVVRYLKYLGQRWNALVAAADALPPQGQVLLGTPGDAACLKAARLFSCGG
jgi:hypothetical protein